MNRHVHDAIRSLLPAVVVALCWVAPVHSQTQGTEGKVVEFEPVTIERQRAFEFDASPEWMFELMSPEEGNHWTGKTPEYLFGSSEQLSGAMWRKGDAWFVVAEHNPEKLLMRTVLWIKDQEYMIEDATCEPNDSGGTTMTLHWKVAGISEESNEGVKAFFEQYWDQRMDRADTTYTRLLKKFGRK